MTFQATPGAMMEYVLLLEKKNGQSQSSSTEINTKNDKK
jgi:hypothetical protein